MPIKTYFWCAERTEQSIYVNKASGIVEAEDYHTAIAKAELEARKCLNNTKAFVLTAFNLVE